MHLRQKEKKKKLLSLDNFLDHKIMNIGAEIYIITLEFLPSNTTSHYQPMDASIITSFKVQLLKRFCTKINWCFYVKCGA